MCSHSIPFIHPDEMPQLYALVGKGHCMEPRLHDGADLVFTKQGIPTAGDIVGIVFTKSAAQRWKQPGLVKRLVMALPPAGFAGIVVVEQLQPPRRYFIPTDDVLAVHRCLGVAERINGEVRISRALLEA